MIDSARVAKEAPLLVLAARHVGGPAIRHMGAVGGNVCTASPAGNGLLALLALEARVELLSRGKRRLIPLRDFLIGPGKTDLRRGELLRAVAIPGDGGRPFFRKVAGERRLPSASAAWRPSGTKRRGG
ncbi:FAD binding domain-containing protein [Aminirod propionatiphilus]|uniref:FAD binding domain-containing protein n=1 Tax=Aminirod propionatiphilus TaxID=3415223 RepID=A0ACD1DZR2_9BACT|nr:FAD binding domain-containing protein [Synergistota bacterium]